jgi:hypothetical protein
MLCQSFVQGSESIVISRRTLVLVLVLVSARARAGDDSLLAVDGLTGTDGHPVRLERYLGKPAVVFYEDRGSTGQNQAVKDVLFARGRRDGLLDAVSVVAVANIAAYNFFPARDIATAFIRRLERAAGIPIVLDVDGTLLAPPWNLPGDASTVLLLDASGRVVWRHSGRLAPDEVERLLTALQGMAGGAGRAP